MQGVIAESLPPMGQVHVSCAVPRKWIWVTLNPEPYPPPPAGVL